MGKRVVFVLLLGGCFSLNFDLGGGDTAGCARSPCTSCWWCDLGVVCALDLTAPGDLEPADLPASPGDLMLLDGGALDGSAFD